MDLLLGSGLKSKKDWDLLKDRGAPVAPLAISPLAEVSGFGELANAPAVPILYHLLIR